MNSTTDITWLPRSTFMELAQKHIQNVDVVLDIGTGIVPRNYINPYVYICCEPYDEYVKHLQINTKNIKDKVFIILNRDWEHTVNTFAQKSVDTVFLIDVIEHLEKPEGKVLLKLTEGIVRKQIVIFTPLGYVHQETLDGEKDAWGLNGADWQEHKSGWHPEDFNEEWKIVACEDFHTHNNIGQKLEKPEGALWAIKTFNDSFTSTTISTLDQEIQNEICEKSRYLIQENINYPELLAKNSELTKKLNKMKNSRAIKFTTFIKKTLFGLK